jgi:hypothetical protein
MPGAFKCVVIKTKYFNLNNRSKICTDHAKQKQLGLITCFVDSLDDEKATTGSELHKLAFDVNKTSDSRSRRKAPNSNWPSFILLRTLSGQVKSWLMIYN